jgi:hypothetical protein
MLETKERLKAESNLRKEQEAKTSAIRDADTAFEGRKKSEEQLTQKQLQLDQFKTEMAAQKSNSLV